MRVRRSWMLQPGGGGCSIQRPHRQVNIRKNQKFIKVRPRAASTIKKSRAATCPASCGQHFKATTGKILVRAKFCLTYPFRPKHRREEYEKKPFKKVE